MHYFLLILVYQQINSQDNNVCIRCHYIDNLSAVHYDINFMHLRLTNWDTGEVRRAFLQFYTEYK